jgi:outer membrane protein assembly factor BamD (BamD/ComL family)
MMRQAWQGEEARERKRWAEAEAAYLRVLDRMPDQLDGGAAFPSKIRLRLLDAALAQDKTEQALEHVEAFLRLNPGSPDALEIKSELISILREEGRLRE